MVFFCDSIRKAESRTETGVATNTNNNHNHNHNHNNNNNNNTKAISLEQRELAHRSACRAQGRSRIDGPLGTLGARQLNTTEPKNTVISHDKYLV